MAGLELAGVILGSVPLVISALEHYRGGLAVMKNMRDYEDVFNDIQSQFGASVSIYMNSCYQLLGPLNLPDRQMKQLLEQRRKVAWSDVQLRRAIESRLGPNYKAYLSLTEKLNKRIELLCKKLRLNDDLKPPWVGTDDAVDEKERKKFFKSTWTRIRGGFASAKYSTLLQDIDRDIDKISRLTSGAIQLEPLRTEKKNCLHSTCWLKIRDQAQILFESLSSRFYPCTCNHPHQANLRLDLRKGHEAEESVTRFAFLLTFNTPACVPKALPWTWKDIEIESLQFSPPRIAVPTTPPVDTLKDTTRCAPSVTISPSPPPVACSQSPSFAARIDNLCKALVDGSKLECCLGVLEDRHWHHHVFIVTGPGSNNQILESASLKEIICRGSPIATRQKCTLALTLASSVLQLHDTPWLPHSWGTKDIFVLQGHSGDLLPSAYVSQTFSSLSTDQIAAKRRRRCVKNEQVFALGVALLELAHGSPLLSHITPDDLNDDGQQDSMTEVSIATRLADHINKFESENYAKAVLRCIRCNFDSFGFDFEDKEFREKFFEGVVMPLQENWEFVTGRKL